jgi:hypothetical protein
MACPLAPAFHVQADLAQHGCGIGKPRAGRDHSGFSGREKGDGVIHEGKIQSAEAGMEI